jgi:hypothetical protein
VLTPVRVLAAAPVELAWLAALTGLLLTPVRVLAAAPVEPA